MSPSNKLWNGRRFLQHLTLNYCLGKCNKCQNNFQHVSSVQTNHCYAPNVRQNTENKTAFPTFRLKQNGGHSFGTFHFRSLGKYFKFLFSVTGEIFYMSSSQHTLIHVLLKQRLMEICIRL